MIKKLLKKILPPEKQFLVVNLKHTFTRFRQTHYAQNCEDIMVRSLFPKGHKGFYVDIGAHHPYRISNTYLLHKAGWSGINIDANPDTIKLFKKARPKDINLCVGVTEAEEEMTYYKFTDPAVNTFSKEHAEEWKNKKWNKFLGKEKVRTKPLKKILSEEIKNVQKIDLLSVDVEGLDLEVLKTNDWNQFRPKVVVVEAHDFVLEKMIEHSLYKFLKKQGYELKYVAKFSLVFETKQTYA